MTWLFWIFGLATCGGAVGVVLSQNIARMAFWLIVSLGSTAGLFFLLNADFVGTTQLMVYVGGTLVLLIFGVMLTASGPYVTMKTSPVEWVAAAIVSSALLSLILVSAYRVPWSEVSPKPDRQAGVPPTPVYSEHEFESVQLRYQDQEDHSV